MIDYSNITAGDFLAGGGGVTEAMAKIPGMQVQWVLNHDPIAIRTNMFNHKNIKHYWADFYKQDEHEMNPVDFIWASIECTQHSRANGGREKKIGSYTLGWELLRYIKHLNPLVIGIENVPEFKDWATLNKKGQPDKNKKGEEFNNWKKAIRALGYEYSELICNAADYGLPTRRIRYFAFFHRIELGLNINWPLPTHNKNGTNGFKKHNACKNYIDLTREGNSIFGREFNPEVPKGKRNPLSENTLKRIAGGIRKLAPEMQFIFQYYGNGLNVQSIEKPLNSVTTKDRHVLVNIEKSKFIQDHCYSDNFNVLEDPLNPILTRQTKQLITLEKKQFLTKYYAGDYHNQELDKPYPTITTVDHNAIVSCEAQFIADYYGRDNTAHSLNGPANTITTENSKHLITTKAQFISEQYNSNGNPEANNKSIESPLGAITTQQKHQFISAYFNSNGNPETQNQSLENPLNSILTGTNKKALITAIEEGLIDFDIKMRFLDPEELALISTFPPKYFTNPLLKLTKKEQTKLIGNAVPPEWARIIIEPVIEELKLALTKKQAV